jgi:hypothetical protein
MKINPQDVFKGLMRKEGEMERLVSALMNLPASPVWINERHIYTAISLPQGQAFGRFHALSCLISVIKKGYGGNKRKEGDPYFCVDSKYAGCSFNEQSGHKIAFQEYGAFESFHAGEFAEPVEGRPRWFCLGEQAICNLKTQLAIMAEAVGDESIELDDCTRARRKAGFAAFFFEAKVDGGYSMVDVPQIAYNNYQEFPLIFKKGVSSKLECISRDVFDTQELSEFEELLRHIIVLLIQNTHRVHIIIIGPPFCRALLHCLYQIQTAEDVEDEDGVVVETAEIMIDDDLNSDDWGSFNTNPCPVDEQRWRDVLLPQLDALRKRWKLHEMDFLNLIPDLQKLSKATTAYELDKFNEPLLAFADEYPHLHDNFQAKFGLMPSNSRLDEQQHGSLRSGLTDKIGMAQADARQSNLTTSLYSMREERRTGSASTKYYRGSIHRRRHRQISHITAPPPSKQKKTKHHNKTQKQIIWMGEQLEEHLNIFLDAASRLLSEPNHGIPTVTEIKRRGRRFLDNETFEMEKKAEKKRADRIRRPKLTAEGMQQIAATTRLTNDAMLEVAGEQFDTREKITKIAVSKFWDNLATTIKVTRTFKAAEQSLPLFHHVAPFKAIPPYDGIYKKIINRSNKKQLAVQQITTKAQLMKLISNYLRLVKKTASLIHAFIYGDKTSDKKQLVPKSQQTLTKEDILWSLGFLDIDCEDVWSASDSTPAVVKSTLWSFNQVDKHFVALEMTDEDIVQVQRMNNNEADDLDDDISIDFLANGDNDSEEESE